MEDGLSIIIVSWNVRALLDACLRSISNGLAGDAGRSQTPQWAQIIVVDNASTDGTVEWLRTAWPAVRVIANAENLGFGRANNAGMAAAGGAWLLLLNPDTIVAPGALATLVGFLRLHPAAGMAAPRLVYADGRLQRNAFRFPGLAQVFFDLFPLHPRLIESRLNGRYPAAEAGTAPFQIDHPLGAAMLVRRSTYKEVGGFDPGFFMYAEEVDWCRRIRAAGWEIWQVPVAQVTHLAGQSTRQMPGRMYVELWRARYRFYAKHGGPARRRAVRLLVRAGMVRKALAVTWDAWRGRLSVAEAYTLRRAYRAVFRL
ncbi:MAG TPA: glycosyltransferase family 2 protein [Chloroflexia bacterium]|nr:glycosyltransferase family 2 protein [Chloroflexia bacterium]